MTKHFKKKASINMPVATLKQKLTETNKKMSLKHLGPGSDLPVLNKGTLRLYSMLFCPFAQRARLILEHKKIP